MVIRALDLKDVNQLRDIHARYYKDKFDFPNFFDKYLSRIAVTNSDGRIITAGGIRPILESVILTDKSFTPAQRKEALLQILEFNKFFNNKNGNTGIHAFIEDDDNWVQVLTKYGFVPIKGTGLILR